MVALPDQLFYSTQIPVCLWFLTKSKLPSPAGGRGAGGEGVFRDRRKQTLFINARKLGTLVDRVHRELTDEDIAKIANTYHAWRGDPQPVRPELVEGAAPYTDIPGFCKSADLDLIQQHGYVLTPGRYVGAEAVEDDGEPFEEKMTRLVAELDGQFAESTKLEKQIKQNLTSLDY